MAETKTKPTAISVDQFLDSVEDAGRREDARAVSTLMERVSGQPPRMWGPAIVGFGSYHYKYDSGREGDMCRIGFSPRKAQLALYLRLGGQGADGLLARLGKHSTGKGCLYIKKLADVDEGVLAELIEQALAYMDEAYPPA